jgi:hypothetical protein
VLQALRRRRGNEYVGILLVGVITLWDGKRGHKRQEGMLRPFPSRRTRGAWRSLDEFNIAKRQRIKTVRGQKKRRIVIESRDVVDVE